MRPILGAIYASFWPSAPASWEQMTHHNSQSSWHMSASLTLASARAHTCKQALPFMVEAKYLKTSLLCHLSKSLTWNCFKCSRDHPQRDYPDV